MQAVALLGVPQQSFAQLKLQIKQKFVWQCFQSLDRGRSDLALV